MEFEEIKKAVEEVLGSERVGWYRGQWVLYCPFHAESNPSFFYDPEKGVWYCFGCGEGGGVLELYRRLKEAGVIYGKRSAEKKKLKKKGKTKKLVKVLSKTEYSYRDYGGNEVMVKTRFDGIDEGGKRSKSFKIEWKTEQKRWFFYNPYGDWEEVKKASFVVLVEGEKAAEAGKEVFPVPYDDIAVLGYTYGDKEEIPEWMVSQTVLIIPDNDEAGRRKAEKLKKRLKERGVKVAVFPVWKYNLPKGWDIADLSPEKRRRVLEKLIDKLSSS